MQAQAAALRLRECQQGHAPLEELPFVVMELAIGHHQGQGPFEDGQAQIPMASQGPQQRFKLLLQQHLPSTTGPL